MRLAGKVAIVTGGGKGIGRAYSLGLAREGAGVVIADIDEPAARATGDEIAQAGGESLALHTDVASEQSVQQMVDRTIERFGWVDVLINNAGLHVDLPSRPLEEVTIEEWDRVLNVNLRSAFLCTKACVPHMRRQGGGSIINISSVSAFIGGSRPHYGASKAGMIGLTRSLARVIGADNIRINAVAPGATASYPDAGGMSGQLVATRALKRPQVPEDLVGAIIFLASEESAFMTGQTMLIDGGQAYN